MRYIIKSPEGQVSSLKPLDLDYKIGYKFNEHVNIFRGLTQKKTNNLSWGQLCDTITNISLTWYKYQACMMLNLCKLNLRLLEITLTPCKQWAIINLIYQSDIRQQISVGFVRMGERDDEEQGRRGMNTWGAQGWGWAGWLKKRFYTFFEKSIIYTINKHYSQEELFSLWCLFVGTFNSPDKKLYLPS